MFAAVVVSGCIHDAEGPKDAEAEETKAEESLGEPITKSEAKGKVKSTDSYQKFAANAEKDVIFEVRDYPSWKIARVKEWNSSSDYSIDDDSFLLLDDFERKDSFVIWAMDGKIPENTRIYQIGKKKGEMLADISQDEMNRRLNQMAIEKREEKCEKDISGFTGTSVQAESFNVSDEQMEVIFVNSGYQEIKIKSIEVLNSNENKIVEKDYDLNMELGESKAIKFDQISSSEECGEYSFGVTFDEDSIKGQVAVGWISGRFQ